jgi:ribonuclease HI
MRSPFTNEAKMKQKELSVLIENLLEQDEIYWAQRERVNWLKKGDRNSSYFQYCASARRRRNLIKKLKNDNQNWVEGNDNLRPLVCDYFHGLFSSSSGVIDDGLLSSVKTLVTKNMNEFLMSPYTREDVRKALFQIGDMKAPGPDGLHAIFFKRFWHILGDDLTKEVLEAINNRKIPSGWNSTNIVLIPKVDSPEVITQYRPISLCNVVYKIISKMIANRLKRILPEIISPTQSAFVPGRLITDNVLVAYECFHTIKKKTHGSSGFCAVKLDMNKAYDRVEWNFLERMMLKLGFHEQWVRLIMECVSSVSYRVRFNDTETDEFTPTRGLRQGDPLSPYLFLLCSEGLSSMLAHEEEIGNLEGIKVCRNAPTISHLLFADDSLILMKANMQCANTLKRILDTYCRSSGQMVSNAKSSIFFSPNTPVGVREEVCRELNIVTEALSDKYLGLPTMVGVDRSDCFQHLIDRVCQRLKGWKEKVLSMQGKEILLKSVAQAIPSYAMSVFKLPKGICKTITDELAGFWWGDNEEKKKMHWFAWWKLCVPKKKGGLGFRDLHSFNLAMLAKQCWRLIQNPDSLCARVLSAKYYPDGNILKAGPKKGSSYTWQSIVAGIQTFQRGCIWRVGSGSQINIWRDPWIPESPSRKVITPRGASMLTFVEELINPHDGQWDEVLIRDIFSPVDANRILQIPLNVQLVEDFVAWHYTRSGTFSVRSAYHREFEHHFGQRLVRSDGQGNINTNTIWKEIWNLKIPGKIKHFAWKALNGSLPCYGILANRHIPLIPQCPFCAISIEDIQHCLFTCKRAMEVWSELGVKDRVEEAVRQDRSGSITVEILCRTNSVIDGLPVAELMMVAAWYLWWQRRQHVKSEPIQTPERAAISIKVLATNYTRAYTAGQPMRIHDHMWKKPISDVVKINVDAAFQAETLSGATGAIARDGRGNFIAAATWFVPHVVGVDSAEMTAIRNGLYLAERIGCNKVIIESDSSFVAEAVQQPDTYVGSDVAMVLECKQLAMDFASVSYTQCPREANEVAHSLAKNSFSEKSSLFWESVIPDFISHSIVNDMSII